MGSRYICASHPDSASVLQQGPSAASVTKVNVTNEKEVDKQQYSNFDQQ